MLKNVVEKMNILMTISNPFITDTRKLKCLVEKRALIPTGRGKRDLRYVFK